MSFITSEVAGLQTSKYFNVAGVAILVYDYVITLEDETRWVWGRGWDATRFIFTVSRYLPFVGVGMTAYSALRPASRPCAPGLAENIIHILGIIASEVLLVLRTYAFWQGDKRILYGLLACSCVTIAAAVGINVTPTRLLPEGHIPPGCLIASRNSTLVYLCLLVFEMVILFLMVFKQFRAYREVRVPIVRTTYQDGIFYIVCIILITFANVVVDGALPPQFSDLLDIPQIALHSVLSSRIVFNLRKSVYSLEEGDTAFTTIDGIVYDTPTESRATGSESSGSGPRVVSSIV